MRHERTTGPHLLVQLSEWFRVADNVEVGDPPDAFAEDPDNSADVEELHSTSSRPQSVDRQARRSRFGSLSLRITTAALLGRQRAEHELDELERGGRPDVLGEVAPSRTENPVDFRPVGFHRVP